MCASAAELKESYALSKGSSKSSFGTGGFNLENTFRGRAHTRCRFSETAVPRRSVGERDLGAEAQSEVIEETPAPELDDATRHALWTPRCDLVRESNINRQAQSSLFTTPIAAVLLSGVNTRLQWSTRHGGGLASIWWSGWCGWRQGNLTWAR